MSEVPTAIRAATVHDLASLKSLLSHLHGEPVAGPVTEVLQVIATDPSRHLLVAEKEGSLIGTVDLIIVENLTRDCSSWAMLENLVVDPSHRRKGVGKALVEAACKIARQAGCYKVQVVSHARRTAAHRIFLAVGLLEDVKGFRVYFEQVASENELG